MRFLAGLAAGIALFLFGVPALQSAVTQFGYYSDFTHDQAVSALILVVLCIIAAYVAAPRPPAEKK